MRERLDGKQYVELLQEAPSEADRARFARHIGEQSERMQLVIEQLQAPEDTRETTAGELARQVVDSRAAQLAARGLRAELTGNGERRVRGDLFLLQQALANLVDNAIGLSPEGGTIRIALAEDGDRQVFAVRDHGPGAPDYALPQLFERFYSLPRPDTGRKSTGLGLAFAREVARGHGGDADFANAPDGDGAVARLLLPR